MRIRKIQTSGEALITFLTNPDHAYRVVENELPKDSRLIDIVKDSLRNCYWMVIESDTFFDIPEGIEALSLEPPIIRGYKIQELETNEGIAVNDTLTLP